MTTFLQFFSIILLYILIYLVSLTYTKYRFENTGKQKP
jgi:hypothetical protein